MRWLITGGCGFIGRNLVRVLLQRTNDPIRVLDDLSVGKREELASIGPLVERRAADLNWGACGRLELVVADIRDAASIKAATVGSEAIVHLAANTGVGPSTEDPSGDCVTNVFGTLNCLEACRANGVRRFVFASSGAPLEAKTKRRTPFARQASRQLSVPNTLVTQSPLGSSVDGPTPVLAAR